MTYCPLIFKGDVRRATIEGFGKIYSELITRHGQVRNFSLVSS